MDLDTSWWRRQDGECWMKGGVGLGQDGMEDVYVGEGTRGVH